MLSFLLLSSASYLHAQNKKGVPVHQAQAEKSQAANERTKLRDEFIKATKEYKATLEQLLLFHERDEKKAEEKLAKLKDLYTQGLISKRDLEIAEHEVADVQAKSAETRRQMLAADAQVAETLVESEALEQMAKAPPLPAGRLIKTTLYIRYNGSSAWSLGDSWKVQQFYRQSFQRQLPISAFGQSATHDRLGLDHHNAMDVPLNPDSAEGQSLMSFLRNSGISFSAFRIAIPGSATGPHIHIGRPSHRNR